MMATATMLLLDVYDATAQGYSPASPRQVVGCQAGSRAKTVPQLHDVLVITARDIDAICFQGQSLRALSV